MHPHAERRDDHSPTYLRSPLIPGGAEIHCRRRLAGERGGSEPNASTDGTGSPASRLLQIRDLHRAYLIVPTLCVVMPPQTLCVQWTTRIQACGSDAERHRMHPHAVRGDDHSPTYLHSPLIPGGAEIHCRSRLAGECGRSEPKASTGETGSPASRLLQIGDLHCACRYPRWQFQLSTQPTPFAVGERQGAAQCDRQLLRDRQAQSGTSGVAVA